MSSPTLQALLATSVPVVTATASGIMAVRRPPGPRLRSIAQHTAAGLVFAVAATELIPDLTHDAQTFATVAGFAAGVALLLTIRFLPERLAPERAESPLAALVAIGVDVLIDGLLIGIAFAHGGHAGVLLTVALTVELSFLGLAVVEATSGAGYPPRRSVALTAGIASLLVVGGLAGAALLGELRGAPLTAVLSFATAALLYLVAEELLSEAHEQADTPLATSMFFVGFVVMLLLASAT